MRTPPFELIEVLAAVAESRNMVEAARKLGISQPAVSSKLKLLDEYTGIPALMLEGKRKVLTRYGKALHEMARKQIDGFESGFKGVTEHYLEPSKMNFRIGCRPELFQYLVSKLSFPGKITFHTLSSHEALLSLLDHKIDCAVSYERLDSTEIFAKRILRSRGHLVVHKSLLRGLNANSSSKDPSRLFRSEEFLTRTPVVLYGTDGHLISKFLKSVGIPLESMKIQLVAEDWRMLAYFVDSAMGFAVVPDYVMTSNPDVVRAPLPEDLDAPVTYFAQFHKELKKTKAYQQLIESFPTSL